MDFAALSVAVVALATMLITMRYRGQDMSAKTMQDALRPINEALLRHDKDHAAHYATSNTVLRIAQQLTDHEKHDDDRFDQMLSMQEEIRDDIKTLLKR
jgi:hypothetical protein